MSVSARLFLCPVGSVAPRVYFPDCLCDPSGMLRAFALLLAVLALNLAACAPSIAPLYRDYEAQPSDPRVGDSDVFARLRLALADAGWDEAPADAPNVISTTPRTLSSWGFYRTELALDVAPINERFVRVYFHPVRYSFLGGRSKIGYLSGGVRRAVMPALNEALEAQGFVVLGTPRERDEEMVDG